ncbi:hypothetical protein BC831DRAFT_442522 [Entophlyctis helioformis]|nr:hypothetical protein BC831DRAFT_442522 [Entophlyctis helioformis]
MALHPAWDQMALVISVGGTILNLLLIGSILSSRSLRNQRETILNANLALSDILLSLIWTVKYTAIVIAGSLENSIMRDDATCTFEGVFMSSVYTSVFALTSVAVYNYRTIVPENAQAMPHKLLYVWSAGMWIGGIVVSAIPMLFGMRYIHHTTTSYCASDVTTPMATTLAKLSFDIPIFSCCVGIINFSYFMILRKFSLVQKRMDALGLKNSNAGATSSTKSASTAKSTPATRKLSLSVRRKSSIVSETSSGGPEGSVKKMAKNPQSFRIKMAIIKRAIVMTIGFLMCWTVAITCLIYQSFAKVYVPPEVYSVAMLLAHLSVVSNPLVFFVIDHNYKRALFILLRLPESWHPMSSSEAGRSASGKQSVPNKRPSVVNTNSKSVSVASSAEYRSDSDEELDASKENEGKAEASAPANPDS